MAPPAVPMLPVIIFGAKLRPDGTAGRTLLHRVEAACAFGRTRNWVVYVPTGGPCPPSGVTEGHVMARLLLDAGASPGRVLVEETAPDTLASVIACTRLLRARGHAGPVAVASSGYHLPRCIVLMRMMGWDRVIRVPPPPVPAARGWRKRWFWRLREGAALPWDVLLLAIWRLRGGHDGD